MKITIEPATTGFVVETTWTQMVQSQNGIDDKDFRELDIAKDKKDLIKIIKNIVKSF